MPSTLLSVFQRGRQRCRLFGFHLVGMIGIGKRAGAHVPGTGSEGQRGILRHGAIPLGEFRFESIERAERVVSVQELARTRCPRADAEDITASSTAGTFLWSKKYLKSESKKKTPRRLLYEALNFGSGGGS